MENTNRQKCFFFYWLEGQNDARFRTAAADCDDNDASGVRPRAGRKHFFPFEAVLADPQLLPLPYLEGGSPRWKTKLEGISLVLLKWLYGRRAERLPGGADVCVCVKPRMPAKFVSAE